MKKVLVLLILLFSLNTFSYVNDSFTADIVKSSLVQHLETNAKKSEKYELLKLLIVDSLGYMKTQKETKRLTELVHDIDKSLLKNKLSLNRSQIIEMIIGTLNS